LHDVRGIESTDLLQPDEPVMVGDKNDSSVEKAAYLVVSYNNGR